MSSSVQVPTCPVCWSAARSPFMDKAGYPYSKCTSCGHIYASERPDEAEIETTLDEWGKSHHGDSGRSQWELKPGFARAAYWGRAQIAEKYRLNSYLLDVGCSTGGFLLYMKNLGWETSGVEISEDSAKIALSRGLDVQICNIEQYLPHNGRKFDVVTMWDVIEHVPDPLEILEKAGEFLHPGGALIILTPNSNSLAMRLDGEKCEAAHPARHLHLFSVKSLSSALKISGYEVEDIRSVDINPFEIKSYIWGDNPALNPENRKKTLEKIKQAADAGPIVPLLRSAVNSIIGRTSLGDGLLAVAVKS